MEEGGEGVMAHIYCYFLAKQEEKKTENYIQLVVMVERGL